jgi:hypothetical protein
MERIDSIVSPTNPISLPLPRLSGGEITNHEHEGKWRKGNTSARRAGGVLRSRFFFGDDPADARYCGSSLRHVSVGVHVSESILVRRMRIWRLQRYPCWSTARLIKPLESKNRLYALPSQIKLGFVSIFQENGSVSVFFTEKRKFGRIYL